MAEIPSNLPAKSEYLLPLGKYKQMKKELTDVVNIFLDDTSNAQQTTELITQVSEAAIAIQGLGEVEESEDKAKVAGLLLLDIALEKLKGAVIQSDWSNPQ